MTVSPSTLPDHVMAQMAITWKAASNPAAAVATPHAIVDSDEGDCASLHSCDSPVDDDD